MTAYVITNARIFDGTGREPFAAEVVVHGNRIARRAHTERTRRTLSFSPMETLVAATKHGGEIMGRPGELGLVTPGALADLLIVAGDPLADITVLQDGGKLAMIMKDGVIHTSA